MWVWSDDLAERFPAFRTLEEVNAPLIAYAVEGEDDLEPLAREVLSAPTRARNGEGPSRRSAAAAKR